MFYTAKPLGGYEITVTETNFINEYILKPFSVLTVTPQYVEADYNYLTITADVNFDPTRTNKTANEINVNVINAIKFFCNQNLDTFNSTFKVSQLSRAIDDVDQSITSNDVAIAIEKRFTADVTRTTSYSLDFGTELIQGTTSQRLVSAPSFGYRDAAGIERNCFLEEVLQSFTGLDTIDVLAPGSGYVTTPDVLIDGDCTGASARALIVNGSVKKIEIVNQGTGYTSASVIITGGGGGGALARVNLQGRNGKLRIYYFDSNNIKKTITEDIGIIDYQNGIVKLNNFSPTSVDDPFGTIIIRAIPKKKIFGSVRNRIITLDNSDPTAIVTTINAVVEP